MCYYHDESGDFPERCRRTNAWKLTYKKRVLDQTATMIQGAHVFTTEKCVNYLCDYHYRKFMKNKEGWVYKMQGSFKKIGEREKEREVW